MNNASLFALCAALLVPCAATAEPAPSPSPSALLEIGHVVTSDRRDEPIADTSRPTFVVDRARIEAHGYRTVADALAAVPGLSLFRYAGFGSLVNYGTRGATSAQTLVLVDGQPVASPDAGTAYLDTLSTIGVARIEVVESGSSTLYGTGASGVINVITSVPRGAYLSASLGSFADRDVRFEAGDGTAGIAYERHVATETYDYPALAYNAANSFPAGVRTNAYADATSVRAALDHPFAGGFRVKLRADDTALGGGVPGRLDFVTPATTQGINNGTGSLELSKTGPRSTLSLTFSGARNQLTFADPSFGEDDTYTGRSQVSLKDAVLVGDVDLVTGIDLARESGIFVIPPVASGATQSQSALYLQAGGSPFSNLRVTGGLRAEHDAPQGSVLVPSLGGVLRSGSLSFAGNLGETFRVPTLVDLYYPGFSNPALLPEKAATSDFTVALEKGPQTLSLGWFSRAGSNFIVVKPPAFLPYNAGSASVAGLQFTARSRSLAGYVVEASFTDTYRALDLSSGARLPEVPNGQATLSISRTLPDERFAWGAIWHIVGSDGDDLANAGPPLAQTFDAYDTIDAFVRYRVAPSAVISLRAFDLTNERFAPVYGYPAPGRRVYVELATR